MNRKLPPFAAICYSVLAFVLKSLPSEELPTDINYKTAPLRCFCSICMAWLFVKTDYLKVIIGEIALGVFIEFWQGILPENFHRSYEVLDLVADGFGTLIGCLGFWLLRNFGFDKVPKG